MRLGNLRIVLLTDLLAGLRLPLKYALRRPVTIQYPEEHRPIAPRYRGRQRLAVREDGSLKCVACGLCAAVCPSRCIYLEPGELPNGDRFPKVYELEVARCVFCGFCAEVCPFEAIVLPEEFELAVTDKRQLLYDKAFLSADQPKE